VVGFLPLAALIAYTLRLLLRERRRVWADLGTCGLAAIILFLIFVDNNFKVNFRQPYPGIFSFFLWGLLLARLSRRRAEA
jgi:peptidoglycan/LPS O-acetylase OafA/YrhL